MGLIPIQQNQSTYPITFGPIILSSDHLSSATGKTLTVTISKNGGAYAAPSGAISEVGNGIYSIAGNATDSNTLGPLQIYAIATGCDPYNDSGQVVAYNPYASTNLGLSALPTASPAASGGIPTVGTGAGQITPDGSGNVLLSNGTSAGQLSLSAGKVLLQATQTGVTIPTVTNVTNAPTAGDFTSTMKTSLNSATPASVTGNVGGVSGVTFPATVASPTNITGGTITTVTNLTNAPSSGDFTATMKTSLNSATPASITGAVASVTGNVGGNVVGSVASVAGNIGGNVVGSVGSVTGAVASVTGNVGGSVVSVTNPVTLASSQTFTNTSSANQTGDSFAVVNNGTYGNAAIKTIVSACQTILNKFGFDSNNNVNGSLAAILGTALTETTGYLAAAFKKFFNIAVPTLTTGDINQTGDSYAVVNNGTYGNAALQTAIANITNFTSLAVLYGPTTMVRPEASTEAYLFTMVVKNETGALVALDASPTITIKNTTGTDRSANLGAITNPQTGVYQVIYTCTYTDANEDLQMIASGAVATSPRIAFANSVVADAESNSALATILAQVNKMTFTVPNRIDATTTLDVALADVTTDAGARATGISMIRALFNRFYNQVAQTATTQTVSNDSGTTVSTMTTSDNGTIATKGKSS